MIRSNVSNAAAFLAAFFFVFLTEAGTAPRRESFPQAGKKDSPVKQSLRKKKLDPAILQDTVTLTALKEWPRPIKQIPPAYPESARVHQVEATVHLRVLVGKNGKPLAAEVIGVACNAMDKRDATDQKKGDSFLNKKYGNYFREPSVTGMMQWVFTLPLMADSTPRNVWVTAPLRYQLSK